MIFTNFAPSIKENCPKNLNFKGYYPSGNESRLADGTGEKSEIF